MESNLHRVNMKIAPNELDFLKNKKLIKNLSSSEKQDYSEFAKGIPKKVIEEISSFPESPIHEDKSWKVVDFIEEENGRAYMRFVKDDEKTNTPEVKYAGLAWFSDDETFKIEQDQLKRGVLKEISERTLHRHLGNLKEEHLENLNVSSRLGTKSKLSNHAKFDKSLNRIILK